MINSIEAQKLATEYKAKNFSVATIPGLLCAEIIERSFGIDFCKKHYSTQNKFSNDERKLDGKKLDDLFFLNFAESLWKVKDCKGFSGFTEKNKYEKMESIYAELYCASQFLKISSEVEFIKESGVKGQDYDLLVKNCLGFKQFYVEVKARTEEFKDPNRVIDFLTNAKKQLPKKKDAKNGSAIMFKIIIPNNKFPQVDLDMAIKKVLLRSNRLSYVIYFWLEHKTLPSGKRLHTFLYRCIDKSKQDKVLFPINFQLIPSYMDDLKKYFV